MSMFLPEGSAPASGVAAVTPSAPEATGGDVALMQRVFEAAVANPNLIPGGFMAYLVDFIQTNNLLIPIGQIIGFDRFTAQNAPFINPIETTTSTTPTDLATVGPTLVGLPSGKYVVLFGAQAFGGGGAVMSLSVNGATPGSNTNAVTHATDYTSLMLAIVETLPQSSNSLTAKYNSSSGASVSFAQRWLLALRYSNL